MIIDENYRVRVITVCKQETFLVLDTWLSTNFVTPRTVAEFEGISSGLNRAFNKLNNASSLSPS